VCVCVCVFFFFLTMANRLAGKAHPRNDLPYYVLSGTLNSTYILFCVQYGAIEDADR